MASAHTRSGTALRNTSTQRQSTNSLLMIEPVAFGYNPETGQDNDFQNLPLDASARFIAQTARQEMHALRDALRHLDVNVTSFLGQPNCPDDVFPNNWVSTTTDKKYILYPMATHSRSLERRSDITDWLQRDYALLKDMSAAEASGRAFEGTGVLVQDHINRRAYVARSQRSDDHLMKEWSQATGYETIAFGTEAPGTRRPLYHTNVIVHIGSGYAAICPELIKASDRSRVMGHLAETHDVISLSPTQILDFCGNALEVSGKGGARYLALSERAYEALTEEQRDRYLQHIDGFAHAPIPTIEKYGGGSVRCMLCELF